MNQNKDQQIKMLKNQFKMMLADRNRYLKELKRSEESKKVLREVINGQRERLEEANKNWFYKLLTGKLWKRY